MKVHWVYLWSQLCIIEDKFSHWDFQLWPGLLEAWLVLFSVKYHGNLYILIPLNQRLALTRLRATGPWVVRDDQEKHSFETLWNVFQVHYFVKKLVKLVKVVAKIIHHPWSSHHWRQNDSKGPENEESSNLSYLAK